MTKQLINLPIVLSPERSALRRREPAWGSPPLGWERVLVMAIGAFAFIGCDDNDPEPAPSCTESVLLLDPAEVHYGQDYAGWASAWTTWLYETPLSECNQLPLNDPTGEFCGFDNDDENVFFLVGNSGGTIVREGCVVPAGKALFFPVIVNFYDNGGVAEPVPEETLKSYAEASIDDFLVETLLVEVDGCAAEGLAATAVVAAPYSYTLPPEPNLYTCIGAPGVTGTYPGYVSGYWVMLPPLEPGSHSIRFAGKLEAGDAVFELDVTFDPLVVE